MPTAVGPNTKGEENLVFGYDLGDVSNSYKGEPTTNVVNDPSPSSAWGISNYFSTSSRSYGVDEDGNPMLIIDVTSVGSGYPRSTGAYLLSTITGTFSTSFEAKAATSGLRVALKIYENGSTKTNNTANLTTEWQRFTFDNQSTGFTLDRPYFNPIDNGTYYIRKIQIEAKAHSTPYVNGTRSATQGLLDLTGNYSIDLSNVSFDSNAQKIFDGTNDRIQISNPGVASTTSFTVEFIIKRDTTGNRHIIISPNSVGVDHFFRFNSNNTLFARFIEIADSSADDYTSTTALAAGKYYHIVMSKTPSNGTFYVNGVAEDSHTPTLSAVAWSGEWRIGARANGSYYFDGEMPIVKVYDRALTAEEVKANFNAIKGRFNI